MQYYSCLTKLEAPQGCSVALGYFDGIHIGHSTVIGQAVRTAKEKGLIPALFTFHLPEGSPIKGPRIMAGDEKHRRAEQMGIELYMSPAFEEFRNFTPEQFVDELLIGCYNAKAVCCGENFTFGYKKSGNADVLAHLCAERNIEFTVLPLMQYEGAPVSSTRVREALQQGNMPLANALLGAPYEIEFEVVKGKGLGHTLGFPTINQHYPAGFQTPMEGVYITQTVIDGREYPSATGYGKRPTVGGVAPTCETFIPGFEGSLYGKKPVVRFFEFLEPTRKYENLQQLTDCVMRAAEASRKYFENKTAQSL